MNATPDIFKTNAGATALCLWREARGIGYQGMTAVACVIRNRHFKTGKSYHDVVFAPLQFSSLTAPHDPQLNLYPHTGDPQWSEAQDIANGVIGGTIEDITNGSTVYYATYIPFPKNWDASKLVFTCEIGNMRFYREI